MNIQKPEGLLSVVLPTELASSPSSRQLIINQDQQDEEASDCPLLTPSPPTMQANNALESGANFASLEGNPVESIPPPTLENIIKEDGLNEFMNIVNRSSKTLIDDRLIVAENRRSFSMSKNEDIKKEVATDPLDTVPKSKKPAPTGKGSRQKRTDAVTALEIQKERHPTTVPISFRNQHALITRTWDTMEAIGTRSFQTLNTPANRQTFAKGILIVSEAKVAFAQRAHIDKPDEDLPARRYYTSEDLRDINNMVSTLPLPFAMYLECIGNVKMGENIVTPLLSEHADVVMSGAMTYAPRQLLPLLRILRTGVPQAGIVHQVAQQLEDLPGIAWEEFVPALVGVPPGQPPEPHVRLTDASVAFWLDGPPGQESIRWSDAEYRVFQKIVRSLNVKKGFNVEVDLSHGNGTPAQFVQFDGAWHVDSVTAWYCMADIPDYDVKLGVAFAFGGSEQHGASRFKGTYTTSLIRGKVVPRRIYSNLIMKNTINNSVL